MKTKFPTDWWKVWKNQTRGRLANLIQSREMFFLPVQESFPLTISENASLVFYYLLYIMILRHYVIMLCAAFEVNRKTYHTISIKIRMQQNLVYRCSFKFFQFSVSIQENSITNECTVSELENFKVPGHLIWQHPDLLSSA